jgi:uncharacterized protein (DUF488 family)
VSDPVIYTVGYSNHEPQRFVELLKQHHVTAVGDVRSSPFSRRAWYCSDAVAKLLEAAGIRYVYLGEQLGARRSEDDCYEEDRVVYERVADAPAFVAGIGRVIAGSDRFRIALMCGERDPLDCHRGILIAPALVRRGCCVRHIREDGRLETHDMFEQRLIEHVGRDPLFDSSTSDNELLLRAYRERGCELAHVRAESHGGS